MNLHSARAGRQTVQPVLAEEEIAAVHAASLKILDGTGILMEHERARSLLAAAGAVAAPGSHLVKVPPALVERCLETAPPEFTAAGGDAAHDVAIGRDTPPRGRPVMSLDWILDYGTAARRQAVSGDVDSWVRVDGALPNMALVTGLYPWDAPPESRDLRAARAMLLHAAKPLLIAPFSGWSVRWIARMLAAAGRRAGGAIVFSSCNSPLIYSEGQMDALLAAVDAGLPVMVNSSAVTGASAPVTLAGTLAVMHAEILAGIVVSQLARPGASVIYAGHPIVFDMRTSIAACGYSEGGLLAAALVDLGRSCRLPAASNGLTTDSHACDEQAAVEKMLTGQPALLAGAALNGGAGSLGSLSTVSLEQLVIDDDIYGRLSRLRDGMAVDEERLAMEVIAAVGPNRHYLEEPHTVKHMRAEFHHSTLASRQTSEVWLQQGGRDAAAAAHERVEAILKETPAPRLGPAEAAEIDVLVAAAERETGG